MVADSTTDSQLFHGSLISRAFFKKPKANWLTKPKQWKIDDPRRSQRKRANVVVGGEEDSSRLMRSNLRNKPTDDITTLKNKAPDDYSDALEQVTEEEQEEAYVDAKDNSSDDYTDALSTSSSTAKPELSPEKPTDQKTNEDECCPICTEKMDATDLLFKPCSDCVFKMCLFCYHKMINEDTGVCPGCRKEFEQQTSSSNSGVATFQQPGGESVTLSSSFQGLDSD